MVTIDTIKIEKNNHIKMIAHRGLSGIELENTIGSFIAAANRSYFGIETDVHKTKDGKFLLIHDDDTNRVSEENLSMENTEYSILRKVKLGRNEDNSLRIDRKIPNLKEYLKICKTYEKMAVIEIKNHFPKSDIMALIDEIKKEKYLEKVTFISFDFENLVNIRKIVPCANIQFLCKEYSKELVEKLIKYKMDVDIKYTTLTKEKIDLFHSKGISVNCWTVNDAKIAEKLIGYGIDFITTNILE